MVAPTPQKLGLRIVHTPTPYLGGNLVLHDFSFVVAKGTPSVKVFTSPEIRSAIRASELTVGQKFGVIRVEYSKMRRAIIVHDYFPLPVIANQIEDLPLPGVSGKGIAQRLEARVKKKLIKLHPDTVRYGNSSPRDPRLDQYEKLGLTSQEAIQMCIHEHDARLRKKVRHDIIRARTKRQARKTRLMRILRKKRP